MSFVKHLASFREISCENGLVLRISAPIIVATSWIGKSDVQDYGKHDKIYQVLWRSPQPSGT